jgi:hypothetical protein
VQRDIGGSPGNANQDGMDWLGGGDALVQDSFIRAADDIFAMYGNWDGYTPEALTTPGHEVSNITVENSVLSTSISNVVRANWPKKIFDSHNFTLRDSDVIHMGEGSCGVPFALLEIWADPAGRGKQTDYKIQDVRLEDWYSLAQLQQQNPEIRNVRFSNIWAMDGPGLAPSALKGDVSGVTFHNVNLGGGVIEKSSDLPLQVMDGAQNPTYANSPFTGTFSYSAGLVKPGELVTFTAAPSAGAHYRWLFGDGTSAEGAIVRHAFSDADGTLLDGTGRFRVLLASTDEAGEKAWSSQQVVVSRVLLRPVLPELGLPAAGLTSTAVGGHSYKGLLRIPADGGYTVTLLTSTTATISIDGVRAENARLRPLVCGSKGDAVQALRISAALSAGLHRIQVMRGSELENAAAPAGPSSEPILLWEGPGLLRQPIPANALIHFPE